MKQKLFQIGVSKKSFPRKLVEALIVFGIPMIGLELLFIPFRAWGGALLLLVPATIVGLTVAVVFETVVLRAIFRAKDTEKPK